MRLPLRRENGILRSENWQNDTTAPFVSYVALYAAVALPTGSREFPLCKGIAVTSGLKTTCAIKPPLRASRESPTLTPNWGRPGSSLLHPARPPASPPRPGVATRLPRPFLLATPSTLSSVRVNRGAQSVPEVRRRLYARMPVAERACGLSSRRPPGWPRGRSARRQGSEEHHVRAARIWPVRDARRKVRRIGSIVETGVSSRCSPRG